MDKSDQIEILRQNVTDNSESLDKAKKELFDAQGKLAKAEIEKPKVEAEAAVVAAEKDK